MKKPLPRSKPRINGKPCGTCHQWAAVVFFLLGLQSSECASEAGATPVCNDAPLWGAVMFRQITWTMVRMATSVNFMMPPFWKANSQLGTSCMSMPSTTLTRQRATSICQLGCCPTSTPPSEAWLSSVLCRLNWRHSFNGPMMAKLEPACLSRLVSGVSALRCWNLCACLTMHIQYYQYQHVRSYSGFFIFVKCVCVGMCMCVCVYVCVYDST